MWPGSQLPPNFRPPRQRHVKAGKRINAPSATQRLMVKLARKLDITPKPRATTEAIGRCLSHAFEELGFTDPWQLALYLDDLARRSPGRKGRNVRIPPEKRPPGVRIAIGVRCKACTGRGCPRCEMHGWGIVYRVAIKKRESRCKHEVAPATPAAAPPTAPEIPGQGITVATVGAPSVER